MTKELKVKKYKISQIDTNKCERIIGVQIGPSLKYEIQLEKMKEKLKIAIGKLRNTPLTITNTHVF